MIMDKKRYLHEMEALPFITASAEDLTLEPSTLPTETIGVFATTCIEKGAVFGPYIGQVVSAHYKHVKKKSFLWEVYNKNGFISHQIDASKPHKSNWMRYINLSIDGYPPNLEVFQKNSQIFYESIKDINPGEELLAAPAQNYNRDYVSKEVNLNFTMVPTKKKKRNINKPARYNCQSCPYSTDLKNLYYNHLHSHANNKLFTCHLCGTSFSYKHVLDFHLTTHQSAHSHQTTIISSHSLKCVRCSREFITQQELSQHDCGLNCNVCGMVIASISSLQTHKKVHTQQQGLLCDICGFKAENLQGLAKHKQRRHASEVCKCQDCGVLCENKVALKFHSMEHTASSFHCMHCEASFPIEAYLHDHLHKHYKHSNHQCSTCSVFFPTFQSLNKHQRSHHPDPAPHDVMLDNVTSSMQRHRGMVHICEVCGFESTKLKVLWVHKKEAHAAEVLQCLECGVLCENKPAYLLHMHTHRDMRKCDVCECVFEGATELQRHRKTHSKTPYKCPICQAQFACKKDLRMHIRMHVSERKFRCEVCKEFFQRWVQLRSHQLTHKQYKPFKCDVCDTAFAQKFSLIIHKRMHTGERPYKCNVCDATFTYNNSLYVHKRTHTGEKPYKCSQCDTSFGQRNRYKSHIKMCSGNKTFKCSTCPLAFDNRKSFTKHVCNGSEE